MRKFALAFVLLCTGLVAVALFVLRDDKVLAQDPVPATQDPIPAAVAPPAERASTPQTASSEPAATPTDENRGDQSKLAIPKPWDGLQGIIMDVDENKHAAISIGADDGVAADDLFRLVRGGNLVGWLKVIELVKADMAILELDGLEAKRGESVVRVGRLVRGSSFPGGKTTYNDLGEGRFEAIDVPIVSQNAGDPYGGGSSSVGRRSRPVTEIDILPLKRTSAADVATTINQLFRSEGVSCGFDGESNSLIVRGSKATLQRVEEMVAQLEEHAAVIAENRKATEAERDATSRAVQFLKDKSMSMTTGLGGRRSPLDPNEIAKLRKAFSAADQRTQQLAAQFRAVVKNAQLEPDKVKLLERRLHEAVSVAFDARQQLQRAEAEALRSRIQDVGRKLERRETLRHEIINKRVSELMDPELRWEPSAPPTPATNSVTGAPIRLPGPPRMARNPFSSLDELDSVLQMEKSLIGATTLVFFTSSDGKVSQEVKEEYERAMTAAGVPTFTIDVGDHPDIAQRFNVKSVPTFVMLVGGREQNRAAGQEFQPLVDDLRRIHLEREGLDPLPGENFRSVLVQELAVELQRHDEWQTEILYLELAAAELGVPITVPPSADAESKQRLEKEEAERQNKLATVQERIAAFQEELRPIDARIQLLRERLAEVESAAAGEFGGSRSNPVEVRARLRQTVIDEIAGGAQDVILFFSAEFCTVCQALKPKLAQREGDPIPIVEIDPTAQPAEVWKAFDVDETPTFLRWANGHEVDRHVGAGVEPWLEQQFRAQANSDGSDTLAPARTVVVTAGDKSRRDAVRLRQASDYATAFRRLHEHIAADEAILKVDPPPENVGIGNVQKHLESARNELAILMQEYEAQVRLLELELEEAHLSLTAAEQRYQQLQKLFDNGAVSTSEMDKARSVSTAARFRVERAKTLVDLYRKAGPPAGEKTPEN